MTKNTRNGRGSDKNCDLMISSIQTDRRLLQDNISMRVRYGWAFIALIVSLLLIISFPQQNPIEFQPEDVFILALVCLVTSIAMVLMGLFSSHYGSSYKLFANDGPLEDRDQLKIEQHLHNKTLYKNQLSSLYNGQSILIAFVGVMILIMSSPVNLLNENDCVFVIISMGCMYFSGTFLKKRMYRMYQIDDDRLPGRGRASVIGRFGHKITYKMLSNFEKSQDFIQDKRIRELFYSIAVMIVAFIIQATLVVMNHIIHLDALDVVSMMFFAAMTGFASKLIYMTVMANIDPSKRDYNTVSWNPLYKISLVFRVMILAYMVATVIMVYEEGWDTDCTLLFAAIQLMTIVAYVLVLYFWGDYLAVLRMDDLEDRYCVSVLRFDDGFVAKYQFRPVKKTLTISTTAVPLPHHCKVIRFSIEHLLVYPSKYDKITVKLPHGWDDHFSYTRGRGDLQVYTVKSAKNNLDPKKI